MKKACLILLPMVGAALVTGCNQQSSPSSNTAPGSTNAVTAATPTNALTSDKDRESYAMGMLLETSWRTNGLELDIDQVLRGMKDVEAGKPTLLTEDEMKAEYMNIRHDAMANHEKMQMQQGQKNQAEGTAFLMQNKTKPGVTTLPDGLQFKVLKEGSGATPGPNDMVTVNYEGTFADGTVFDSSFKRGHPAEFPVTGVIPGWTEALEKMKVGSEWEIYIPSNLAYGPTGRPGIPPNSTLVFKVDLLGIKARPAPPQAQPLTSDIIKVPSAEEMKKGAKIETIKASDLQKMEQAASNNAATNGHK